MLQGGSLREPQSDSIAGGVTSPRLAMSASQWYAANVSYGLFFRSSNLLSQTFISNPMAFLHAKYAMYVDDDSAWVFTRPAVRLARHMPGEVMDQPLRTFIAAIPAMMPAFVAYFVRQVLDAFHNLAWPFVLFQWGRVQMAGQLMNNSSTYLLWVFNPRKKQPKAYHVIVGLLVYAIRWRYFSWLGAHSAPNPIRDLVNVFVDPLQFTEENVHEWKWWLKYTALLHSGNLVLVGAAGYNGDSLVDHAASSFVSFWMFCSLERGFCQAVNAACQVLFYVNLTFQDPETLKALGRFCMRYWFRILLTLTQQGLSVKSIAALGRRWGLVISIGTLVAFWWFITYYEDRLWICVWSVLYPWRMALWAVVRGVTLVWLPALRVIGSILSLLVLFTGAAWFSGFCVDPLNLQGTRVQLQRALRGAEKALQGLPPATIGAGERKSAGFVQNDNASANLTPGERAGGGEPIGPPLEEDESTLIARQLEESSRQERNEESAIDPEELFEAFFGRALTTQARPASGTGLRSRRFRHPGLRERPNGGE